MPTPTPAQAQAGNYKMRKIRFHGLAISIETLKGQRRNPAWPPMPCHYGYIRGTRGRDGDHVDVMLGPSPKSELVVVIDQVTEHGKFDEHKCLIGFDTTREAVDTYRKCYASGWKVGPVTPMTIHQFKRWLKGGNQMQRIEPQVSMYAAPWNPDDHPRGLGGVFILKATSKFFDAMPGKNLRHKALGWARRRFMAKTILNKATGMKIRFDGDSFNKPASHLPDEKPILCFQVLDRLLETAQYKELQTINLKNASKRKKDQEVIGYHILENEINLDGVAHHVTLKVRIDRNGHTYYDSHVIKKASNLISRSGSDEGTGRPAGHSPKLSIGPKTMEVNRYSAADASHRWITTENGSHVLISADGTVKAGMGGKFNGTKIKAKRKAASSLAVSSTSQFPQIPSNASRKEIETLQSQAIAESDKSAAGDLSDGIIGRIKIAEYFQPHLDAAWEREKQANESHPHHLNQLPASTKKQLLRSHFELWDLVKGVNPFGVDDLEQRRQLKQKNWDGSKSPLYLTPENSIAMQQAGRAPGTSIHRGVDKDGIRKSLNNLQSLIDDHAKQGFDIKPFIKHNNLIPRELAAKLTPNDDLFRPVEDHERFSMAFAEVISEHYSARRLRNSPGQLGLFPGPLHGDRPLRDTTYQPTLWDVPFARKPVRDPGSPDGKTLSKKPKRNSKAKSSTDPNNGKPFWRTINGAKVLIQGDTIIAGAGGKLNGRKVGPVKHAGKTPEQFLLGKRSGDTKVIAGHLYEQMNRHKHVSVIGASVTSPEHLAEVAQVYRDPRFETFRAFFIKDGVVVGHNAYTSRMPSFVAIHKDVPNQIHADLASLKADGFYILHNHPSGNSDPSREDIRMTVGFAEKFGKSFLGHTIINHTKGTVIDRNGNVSAYSIDNEDLNDAKKATVPSDILTEKINSTASLGKLAMQLPLDDKDRGVVVFTNARGKVQLVMDVSKQALQQPQPKVLGAMRRVSRQTGSVFRFLVLPEGSRLDDFSEHLASGMFLDMTNGGNNTARESGMKAARDPFEFKFRTSDGYREKTKTRSDITSKSPMENKPEVERSDEDRVFKSSLSSTRKDGRAELSNDAAKPGDQLGLIDGEGKRKASAKLGNATTGKGKTVSMFGDLSVHPDQMSMFGGDGTPDELVFKPKTDSYSAELHEAIVEFYRADRPPTDYGQRLKSLQKRRGEKASSAAPSRGSKLVVRSQGDRGHFVTIDGHPVFIKDGTVNRGPKSHIGKSVKSIPGKRTRRTPVKPSSSQPELPADRFVPKTKLDKAIVDEVGNDPSHVEHFRGFLDDAHNLLSTEANNTNDDLRNLLANFGYSGKKAGHIIATARRKYDHDQIVGFDEMAEMAKRDYPQLLAGRVGESVGRGDHEQALLERLRKGFELPPTKNDDRVFKLAKEMFQSYQNRNHEFHPDDEWEPDLNDPYYDPFGERVDPSVPFAASLHSAIVEFYGSRRASSPVA
jgi:hypothetical protein